MKNILRGQQFVYTVIYWFNNEYQNLSRQKLISSWEASVFKTIILNFIKINQVILKRYMEAKFSKIYQKQWNFELFTLKVSLPN